MKQLVCVTALSVLLLAGLAVGQNASSISAKSALQHNGRTINPPSKPSYCKPCLFYGGDWDPNSSDWVAFGNANNPPANDVYNVYSPFTVPKGQTWTVTGLFSNDITTGIDKLDPAKATWEIRSKMKEGVGGKKLAHGNTKATFKPTGRNYEGVYLEYTTLVKKLPTAVTLTAGRYWETVAPDCTNANDSDCAANYYYVTDNETNANHFGPKEPIMLSFQNSVSNGYNYVNTCNEGYPPPGCQAISAGVLGTK